MVTKTVRVVYEDGVLRLLNADDLDLEDGQEIDVTLMLEDEGETLKRRIPGLHRGMVWMSDDFDDPLPDDFWFGNDEES